MDILPEYQGVYAV